MKICKLSGIILVAVWVAGITQAVEPQNIEESPIRLAVDLADGSRVIGAPDVAGFPLHTLVGKVETPLKHIVDIVFDNDNERSAVTLVNGDRISGTHGLEKLGLTTLFGDVVIDAALIRKITLLAPENQKEE